MAKTVKIKVKLEKSEPTQKPKFEKKSQALNYQSDEGQPWETFPVHHRLAEKDLDLEPWLDEVIEELQVQTSETQIEPQSKVEKLEEKLKEEEVVRVIEEVLSHQPVESEVSNLSSEKLRAVEEIFLHKERERLSPFHQPAEVTEEVASPVVMIWYLVKEKVLKSAGERVLSGLATGWWLVPLWLIGELWWTSKQALWTSPQSTWLIVSWLWPIGCWVILSWLRSNYSLTTKDFLGSLWPIGLLSALILALIEVFWLGTLWSWLNIINLPLFILAVIAGCAWLLTRLGRLNT